MIPPHPNSSTEVQSSLKYLQEYVKLTRKGGEIWRRGHWGHTSRWFHIRQVDALLSKIFGSVLVCVWGGGGGEQEGRKIQKCFISLAIKYPNTVIVIHTWRLRFNVIWWQVWRRSKQIWKKVIVWWIRSDFKNLDYKSGNCNIALSAVQNTVLQIMCLHGEGKSLWL